MHTGISLVYCQWSRKDSQQVGGDGDRERREGKGGDGREGMEGIERLIP